MLKHFPNFYLYFLQVDGQLVTCLKLTLLLGV